MSCSVQDCRQMSRHVASKLVGVLSHVQILLCIYGDNTMTRHVATCPFVSHSVVFCRDMSFSVLANISGMHESLTLPYPPADNRLLGGRTRETTPISDFSSDNKAVIEWRARPRSTAAIRAIDYFFARSSCSTVLISRSKVGVRRGLEFYWRTKVRLQERHWTAKRQPKGFRYLMGGNWSLCGSRWGGLHSFRCQLEEK